MMSIGPAPPAAEAAAYYGKDNYYVKDDPERAVGEWFGKGAKALGLEGAVDLKDFENVLAGRLPNGVMLGKRQGGDLTHRPGDDLTFSMPKSAALLATVGGDKRIVTAYKESVLKTLGYIERNYIETRAKERGVLRREKTDKMVAALFEHDVSRNLDPQLHIHAVVANVTQRRDGKWRSVHNVPIWKNAKLFTQIQSAYFAKGLTGLGYAVEWKETPGHLEIKDFPRDVIEAFSTRSRDIQRVFETLDHKTPEARSKVALKTRPAKSEVSSAELAAEWKERAKEIGFDPKPFAEKALAAERSPEPDLQANEHRAERQPSIWDTFKRYFIATDRATSASADPYAPRRNASLDDIRNRSAVSYAVRVLSEREHAFAVGEIQRKALEANIPGVVIDGIDREIDMLFAEGLLLKSPARGDMVTTHEALDLERETVALMEEGIGAGRRIARPEALARELKDSSLNEGQSEAVMQILGTPDRIVGVQGYAGTGKTFMLKETIEAMARASAIADRKGFELFGLAPSNSAVTTLKEEAGVDGWTLQRFLLKYDGVARGRLSSRGRQALNKEWRDRILVVDESSLASTRQMRDLFLIARKIGIPKLALIGDEKQLGPVEAGKIFELLQARGLPTAYMRDILRQQDETLKQSVYAAIGGRIGESFALLDDRIIEAPGREAETAAKLWASLPAEKRAGTLVISQSNAMRQEMNEAIRAQLKSEGAIHGPSIGQAILRSNHLSPEELRLAQNYKPGDSIKFRLRRGVRRLGIKEGDMLTVARVDVEKGIVTLIDSKGREREWIPSDLKRDAAGGGLESFRRDTLVLQAGDRVKWAASDWKRGFRTNETTRVANVSMAHIEMETASGEAISLPRDDQMAAHLDHAYAMTANEAQGKTAERAIAVIDSKEKNLATRRRFYIQISRVKSDLSLVVDSKEDAQKQISRLTGDKSSALETVEQASKRQPEMDLEKGHSTSSTPSEIDRQLEIDLGRS